MTYAVQQPLVGGKPVTVVEIDLDTCSLTYAGAPCAAVYPDNLVTNGEFAVDTAGWAGQGATISVDTQRLKVLQTSPNGYAYDFISRVVGTAYFYSFDVTEGSTGEWRIALGNTVLKSGTVSGTETITGTFVAVADPSNALILRVNTATGTDHMFFDNVIFREANAECYNTQKSCKDTSNFAQATKTYRFVEPIQGLPAGIEMIPSLLGVPNIAPTRITTGFGLGYRASVTINIQDHTHHDRGYDPYVADRSYTPTTQGTFWGRLLARTPYYQGRTLRVRTGYVTDPWAWDNFESREYVIEQISGPDSNGVVQIVAKDILKLADDERSKVPAASDGELVADIDNAVTTLTVLGGTYTDPAGTSPITRQWVRIGDEIIEYTGISGAGTAASPWSLTGLVRTDLTWGSTASSHSAGDQVQLCKAWQDVNVRDIIDELLVTYAGISSAYITAADWDAEEAQWLSSATLTAIISEPTGVSELIAEMQDQCLVNIWWDEISQKVRFKALSPPVGTTPTVLTDTGNILADTLKVKDISKDRISQVWFYYDKDDYTKDEIGNYKRLYIATDTAAESANEYNESRIHVQESQWFDEDNKAFLAQTASRHLSRYRDNPKEISFAMDAKDSAVKTGDVVDLSMDHLQDTDGSALTTRLLITQVKEAIPGHRYEYMGLTGIGTARYGNISQPTTDSPIMGNYTAESEANQLAYGFICDSTTLKMSNGDASYKIV